MKHLIRHVHKHLLRVYTVPMGKGPNMPPQKSPLPPTCHSIWTISQSLVTPLPLFCDDSLSVGWIVQTHFWCKESYAHQTQFFVRLENQPGIIKHNFAITLLTILASKVINWLWVCVVQLVLWIWHFVKHLKKCFTSHRKFFIWSYAMHHKISYSPSL